MSKKASRSRQLADERPIITAIKSVDSLIGKSKITSRDALEDAELESPVQEKLKHFFFFLDRSLSSKRQIKLVFVCKWGGIFLFIFLE